MLIKYSWQPCSVLSLSQQCFIHVLPELQHSTYPPTTLSLPLVGEALRGSLGALSLLTSSQTELRLQPCLWWCLTTGCYLLLTVKSSQIRLPTPTLAGSVFLSACSYSTRSHTLVTTIAPPPEPPSVLQLWLCNMPNAINTCMCRDNNIYRFWQKKKLVKGIKITWRAFSNYTSPEILIQSFLLLSPAAHTWTLTRHSSDPVSGGQHLQVHLGEVKKSYFIPHWSDRLKLSKF